ncbi:ATP-dependent helicase Rep [Caerostris extrusa]|uniref:ATP-dependent helicase Rep n=1 Tax=Caerostris extrusa TaxID=172846 RepID=A0AAV4NTJ7_CAEEX|nr:ATP-dependent helicase Rep [Caerostris extrusa]
MAPRQYAKRWCFTINNPHVNDHPSIWLHGHENYGFQYEIGENNTPHVQGFVCFTERRSLQQVKQLHGTSHWETMKGSIKQNIEYCSKRETSIRPTGTGKTGQIRGLLNVIFRENGLFDVLMLQLIINNLLHKIPFPQLEDSSLPPPPPPFCIWQRNEVVTSKFHDQNRKWLPKPTAEESDFQKESLYPVLRSFCIRDITCQSIPISVQPESSEF